VPQIMQPEPLEIRQFADSGPVSVQVTIWTSLTDEQLPSLSTSGLELVQDGQSDVVERYGPSALRF